MKTEMTLNHIVFDLIENAAQAIESYFDSGDREALNDALTKITRSRPPNSTHPSVLKYRGILEDLLGKHASASASFAALMRRIPSNEEEMRKSAEINANVAKYHDLRAKAAIHKAPKDAEHQVDQALSVVFPLPPSFSVSSLNSGEMVWFAHRQSLLARFLALRCIPKDTRGDGWRPSVAASYEAAVSRAKEVILLKQPLTLGSAAALGWRQAQALARNALGRAEMYHTDYFGESLDEKIIQLKLALASLEDASAAFQDELSYSCDLGSCHMRLGYWATLATRPENDMDPQPGFGPEPNFEADSFASVYPPAEFEMAKTQLEEILKLQRPGYAFAEFEIGRVFRLQSQFEEAKKHFVRAQEVPEDERDVSNARVKREIDLNERRSTIFP